MAQNKPPDIPDDRPPDIQDQSAPSKIWDTVNTPTVTPGNIGPEMLAGRQLMRETNPILSKGFDFGLEVLGGMTSPFSVATGGALGIGTAAKIPGLLRAGKLLSYPTALHGANTMYNAESPGEFIGGGLELAGGIAGARTKIPTPKAIPLPKPRLTIKNGELIDSIGNVFDNDVVILNTTDKATSYELSRYGYKSGGIIQEGTHKGKPYMIQSDIPKFKETSLGKEMYNLSRGLTTTWDMSAPLRQGLPLITTRAWWKNLRPMWQARKSDEIFKNIVDGITTENDLFKPSSKIRLTKNGPIKTDTPSIAQEAGIEVPKFDQPLSANEEIIGSNLVEKYLPGAKASNRAYVAYLFKLRSDAFTSMYKDAQRIYESAKATGKSDGILGLGIRKKDLTPEQIEALNPQTNKALLKEIGDFVNTATGRGPLRTQLPTIKDDWSLGMKERSLEQNSDFLSNAIFSPKLVASRVRMLNPGTYTQATPQVRRAYLKAALSTATAWSTMAGLGKLAGAEVSSDPLSADFGKIRIGNTRLDPAGGFQQFLVAYSRLIAGEATASTSGTTRELGVGYKADTRRVVGENFLTNKLHPVAKFAYDLADASEYRPVAMGDRLMQMYVPLIVQDIVELAKEDPKLLPLTLLTGLGMGTQIYDKGGKSPVFIDPENDFEFEGGKFRLFDR